MLRQRKATKALQTFFVGYLLLNTFCVCSFVTLTSQGYENVLVTISDDVPITNCRSVIDSIKVASQETSSAICTATESRAFFKNVSIVIPNQWPTDCIGAGNTSYVVWPRVYLADVIISQDDPVFGSQPLTFNYGGCGINSSPIRIPISFVTSTGSSLGIELAHEWFHYRYGVFDESGVKDDPLHPNGYQIAHQSGYSILPTSCTNQPLSGNWIGNEWENSGNNQNITSSLMFSTSLPNIRQVCTEKSHLKAPPTKQNWHCHSASVSDIVYSHRDFDKSNGSKTCIETHFNVISNPLRGYHIIIDTSISMGTKTSTSMTLLESAIMAVSHFIWFLPDGSIVSIDTFSSTMAHLQTPIALNFTTKKVIIESLSKVQTSGSTNTDGFGLAINSAIRMFRSGLEIVLLTAIEELTESQSLNAVIQEFHDNLIAPHVLALNTGTTRVLSDFARDGRFYFIPKWTTNVGSRTRTSQTWMVDILHSIFSATYTHRSKVEEKTIELTNGWNNNTFILDSSGDRLHFAFYPLDNNYGITFIQGVLKGPDGISECTIARPTSVAFYPALCQTNTAFVKGEWSYFLNVIGSGTVRVDVWVENSNGVRVESWTHSFQNNPIDWTVDRVVIYASISQQKRLVSGSSPVAYISGDNGSDVVAVALNENNPSDITKGDGIYSAIVTQFPKSSTHFAYVVEIIEGVGSVDSGRYNGHPMSGSLITVEKPTLLETAFNRYVYGGSFELTQNFDSRDVLPPGRVTNLALNYFDFSTATAEFGWVAPKDDYGSSLLIVERFVLTCQDDSSVQEDVIFNGTVFPIAGSLDRMILTIAVPIANYSLNVYFRLYPLDSLGNQGLSSNTVTLYVPAVDPSTPDGTGNDSATLPPALFWFLIGLGILTLILIAAILGWCIYKKRKAKQKRNVGADWVQPRQAAATPNDSITEQNRTQQDVDVGSLDFRRSKEWNSEWSEDGYSVGSEMYGEPQILVTSVDVIRRSSDIEESSVGERSSYYSSDSQIIQETTSYNPSTQTISSRKSTPPQPPPRRYLTPTGEQIIRKHGGMGGEGVLLASSPSYLSSNIQDTEELTLDPKKYPFRTLTFNSNPSLTRYGIVLDGADTEASLV